MEFRQIRYLLEIIRGGGFTRAAETLGISQPSLSIAVQKLEDELGVTLINRQERKIALTAEGRAFFERACQIEELFKGTVHEMEEFRGLEKGEVRIGIPGMLATHYFPALIAQFRELYPDLKLSVHSAGANSIQSLIESGALDAGIVSGHELPDWVESRGVIREEIVACVAAAHTLASKPAMTLEELSHEPLFLFSEGFFQRQAVTDAMAARGLVPNVVFETNLVPLLKKVTAQGGGVSTLLRMAVEEPELKAISFSPPLFVDAVVIWKRNAYLSRAARTFLEFLQGAEK
ncbi:LysR family transcriptional regulator [Geomonas sp.]|uniref:LysR family transcriptional regulator n=1 Tax=Geomonas sp. TaxID=2651584 RepID=UPI002B4A8743|nr:LysR substrate-binding domain-containing protein [Geomonas sp.]HJV35835.1 LysR substrate-binding domain-containing protein [Geomonas sp.]